MGLDMYLERVHWVGANYNHNNIEIRLEATKNGEPFLENVDTKNISEIVVRVAYWRKANAIHNWFVENVARGIDNCQPIDVSVQRLRELYDLCVKVKENPELAEELLPTVGGFFFGSTEYDDWYWQDIDDTIRQLEPLISIEEETGVMTDTWFSYQASW